MFDEEKDETTNEESTEETTSEESSQQETVGKTRVKVADEDKTFEDKDEIICPLVLKVTNGRGAVNYDLTWLSTTMIKQGVVGCWRSAPQSRPHAEPFYKALEQLKEDGQIPKDWNAFYFTHEQGIAAREKYVQLVLTGKVKANKKSWTNRFRQSRFAGVEYEDLMEGKHITDEKKAEEFGFDSVEDAQKHFKALYSASTPRKAKEIIESEKPTLDESALQATDDLLDSIEPDDSEILSMTTSNDEETEEEAEAEDLAGEQVYEVAGTTVAESDIAGIETLRPELELDEVEVNLGPFDEFQELLTDAFMVKDSGEEKKLYLFQAPHNEELYCLPEGRHLIDGCLYNIQVEGEEEVTDES